MDVRITVQSSICVPEPGKERSRIVVLPPGMCTSILEIPRPSRTTDMRAVDTVAQLAGSVGGLRWHPPRRQRRRSAWAARRGTPRRQRRPRAAARAQAGARLGGGGIYARGRLGARRRRGIVCFVIDSQPSFPPHSLPAVSLAFPPLLPPAPSLRVLLGVAARRPLPSAPSAASGRCAEPPPPTPA